ncbi:MAG: type II secretion system protein GspK [Candidatus Omnitrophica bacterium]|nr:type II secretion system protein GspK [Candidatus Omnitrophota bacterium]
MRSPTEMKRRAACRGSILILTLWLVLFLSIFMLSVGYSVRQRLKASEHLDIRQRLRFASEAGVKRVMNMLSTQPPKAIVADTLNQNWSVNPDKFCDVPVGMATYSVVKYAFSLGDWRYENEGEMKFGAVDEESKVNINKTTSAILTRLFQRGANLSTQEADAIGESVEDWRDEDDFSNPSGAESRHYKMLSTPYVSKNKDFDVLEELLFVKGITPEIYRQMIPYVTVKGSGKVNINTAPAVVLYALGFPESLIRKVVSYRNGRDQKIGTADDGVFTDNESIIPILEGFASMDDGEKAVVNNLIQLGQLGTMSNLFWIQSVGQVPNKSQALVVQCLTDKSGKIKHWREIFV